jgi:hypothetical protein
MKAHLGEEGTEQFSVETLVDGKTIRVQPIHDPFIHSTTTVSISRWDHFLAIFKRRQIRVQVFVSASEGAQRAVMTLNPEQLARDSEEILHERKLARESSPTVGYCVGMSGKHPVQRRP